MTDYAIGDVQGCFEPLQRLLDHIDFDDKRDRLWFVGDLVNRGPDSLEVLRFLKQLPIPPCITLGNHDLHLLSQLFGESPRKNADDTLDTLLNAPDAEELGHWLRMQSILIHHPELNVVMCHAGMPPIWNLDDAKTHARELELTLSSEHFRYFLSHMYGNLPLKWSTSLKGIDRLRVICNYFTRMRLCDAKGDLALDYKGPLSDIPASRYPWYAVPTRRPIPASIVFGHWAALEGMCPVPQIYAIDTGCVWGRSLTALRLIDKQRFAVPGVPRIA